MLTAREMTLEQVDRLLPLEERLEPLSFSSLLTLEPLSDREQQEIIQIRTDYQAHLRPERSCDAGEFYDPFSLNS